MILKWKSPFNKENWERWGVRFCLCLNIAKPRHFLATISPDEQSQTDKHLPYSGQLSEFGEVDQLVVIDKLSMVLERLLSQNQPSLPIADKLPEAQALTGLSRKMLRSAIKEGQLKAEKIGHSWRIKRSDLDEYVAKLF